MGTIDAKNIFLQVGEVLIQSSEFADSAIEVDAFGDRTEIVHGLAGGKERRQLYNQEDKITFTLFQSAASLKTLESYYYAQNSSLFVFVRDVNSTSARAYQSINCQVKSMSALQLGTAEGVTVVIDCAMEGLKPLHVA
jgi:hypothetical protein